MTIERGKAHSPHLSTQVRDFSGLRFNKITPTDIDCSMDFAGRLFIFVEAKLPQAELPCGQRLHLQLLTDTIVKGGAYAMAIICEHQNRTGEIDFANCAVLEYRWKGAWRVPKEPLTVKSIITQSLSRLPSIILPR